MKSRQAPTRLQALVYVGLAALLGGCQGGFYKPQRVELAAPVATGATPSTPAKQWPYLSAALYFDDSAVHDATFRDQRNGDLSHLFVRVSFDHPALGGLRTVPLYLLDLEHGSLDQTSGAELIAKLPVAPNRRRQYFMDIEVIALEKSKLEIVKKIWEKAKPLVTSALAATGIGGAAGVALDTASGLLDDLTASKDYRSTLHIATPAVFPGDDGRLVYLLYLIVPTDKRMVIDAHAEELGRKDLTICRRSTGEPFVCVQGEPGQPHPPYTTLPYIIVEYRASDYLDDERLIAQAIDARCVAISAGAVTRAQQALDLGHDQLAISSAQRVYEQALVTRASGLMEVRTRTTAWAEAAADPGIANAPGKQAVALEAVLAYLMLERDAPDDPNDRGRLAAISGCVTAEASRLPVYRVLESAIPLLSRPYPADEAAKLEVLTRLRPISSLDQQLARLGLAAVLEGSTLKLRASLLVASIEEDLLRSQFAAPIAILQADEATPQERTAANQKLSELVAGPLKVCETCRFAALDALKRQAERTAPAETRRRLVRRFAAVEDATRVTQALRSRAVVDLWTGGTGAEATAKAAAIDLAVPPVLAEPATESAVANLEGLVKASSVE